MNLYATKDYYCDIYSLGANRIPEEICEKYLAKATAFLNGLFTSPLTGEVSCDVKHATCEIAEAFYLDDGKKGIKSEQNDGYSVSYDDYDVLKNAVDIALIYLGNSGLLYRGIG
ncbi:MAG: hypothetical protein IJC74_02360 [Clostridia bacterium]|nr:hypothetical protein [Clostridia bacterium]